jgi:hypothetical protein
MTDLNLETATDSQETLQSQETTAKNFTQDDLDKIVADRIARERSKYEKKFAGVDLDHYRQLSEEAEQRQIAEQTKRGEFETILKTTVEKKDTVIQKLQSELQTIKIDGQLLDVASRNRAVNPQQVVQLLKNQVRLGETGSVEVVDREGRLMYSDSGEPLAVSDLVGSFLKDNPHFVTASAPGSGTRPTAQSKPANFDISKLDMNNPEHRKQYAEYRKTQGLA